MAKQILLLAFAFFFLMVSINAVSAYSHSYSTVSDRLDYRSTVTGPERGFSLERSTDVSRQTCDGYWDWSANPRPCITPADSKIPQPAMNDAFKTYRQESAQQHRLNELQEIREITRRPRYGIVGGRLYGISETGYMRTGRVYAWGFR
jgi:hypothetical protein